MADHHHCSYLKNEETNSIFYFKRLLVLGDGDVAAMESELDGSTLVLHQMNLETGEECECKIGGNAVHFKEDGENYNTTFSKPMNDLFVAYHYEVHSKKQQTLMRTVFYDRKAAIDYFKGLRKSDVVDAILVCGTKKTIILKKQKTLLRHRFLRGEAEKDCLLDPEGTEMTNESVLGRAYVLLQPYQITSALAS